MIKQAKQCQKEKVGLSSVEINLLSPKRDT